MYVFQEDFTWSITFHHVYLVSDRFGKLNVSQEPNCARAVENKPTQNACSDDPFDGLNNLFVSIFFAGSDSSNVQTF